MLQKILLLVLLLLADLAHANEATLTANTVTTETINVGNKKQTLIKAQGKVRLSSPDFEINTEEMIVNNVTKITTFPTETKILYHNKIPITILSQYLTGNPDTHNLHGKDIFMRSEIVSYKSKTIDVKKPIATFKTVKFSTCQMFKENGTECNVPWHASASTLTYNYETQKLTAKNFRLNLHRVPIFYIPYIKLNLNKKKEGFQNFNIITANGQQGLTFDYVHHSKQHGIFTIRPEFYLNQNNTSSSRSHNISFLHNNITPKGVDFKTEIKLAPNVNTQNADGTVSWDKATRYYIKTENKDAKEHSAFSSALNVASDRFFRQIYNMTFENYLTSSITYKNFNHNDLLYSLDSTHYRSVTENNQTTIPSLISSAHYNKTLNNPNNGYRINSNNEILNFHRINGTSGTRTTTMLEGKKLFKVQGLYIETNPNISLSHYAYTGSDKPQNQAYRIVSDINTSISKPLVHSVGNFVTQTKPIIFFDYTAQKSHNTIVNEDSFVSFVTDTNVFLPSRYNGIDLVDEGLKAAYGFDFQAQSKKNHKFNFFIAQRYNTENKLSNYVGRIGTTFEKTKISSRFIINKENNRLLFSNSTLTIQPFSFLETTIGYFFLDQSLQNEAINNITDTENITYSATLQYNNHFIFTNIIQNPSFIGQNGEKQNVITELTGGVGYKSDCLNYRLGIQRRFFFTGTQNISINSFILEFKITK